MTTAPFLGTALREQVIGGIVLSENVYAATSKLPRHEHSSAFFSLTLAGGYVERHTHRDLDYRPGTIAFHPPHEEHSVAIGTKTVQCLNIEVGDDWMRRLQEVDAAAPRLVSAETGPLVWLAARLRQELVARTFVTPLMAEGLVLEMLAVTAQLYTEEKDASKPRWLRKAEEILREQFDENLTVSGVAADAGVHPVHLSRTWRRFRGCSLGHSLHEIRVEQACRRLAADRVSLANLALEVGFADQTHFTRVFKQFTGTTPGAYRAAFRS